ncbi:hypothetical protein [Campylobacter lari]|uniref:hypothetical protein n=1 Tax=Campylobacter lari TaxID=201 RepID=UPI0012880694|nr:hypothetical protein [Campylobacter lari]EAH7187495.1 hypothetical protein [Campylobacter lari]EAK0437954.1 hypothetical protein [Campylobacter lari]EEA6125721.1 hypothetical protein [Campylobacter lari]EEP1956801.1 hypothetical protein [Campylobacter lari]EGK8062632.1 hypothetical protein [Campylobacter lari]
MQEKIQNIIFYSLKNLADELENDDFKNPNLKTKIYGINGNLDSLALVSLVSDLEELLSEEFNKEIVLADEKMMSARNSPFKDVESLTDYIIKKLQEQE